MNIPPSSANIINQAPSRDFAGERKAMYEANHQGAADRTAPPPSKESTQTGQRMNAVETMQSRVVENHGMDMKQYTKEALTNNVKILNTPVMQRGGLLDVLI